MAFKPIIVEETIDGILYKAQFNGIRERTKLVSMISKDIEDGSAYVFENVLVEPKIPDVDEYFGTNAAHYDKVLVFLTQVGTADSKYFPAVDKTADKGKGK